jgi:hypothetical protein
MDVEPTSTMGLSFTRALFMFGVAGADRSLALLAEIHADQHLQYICVSTHNT